jgi:hypothetical protein
MIQSTRKSASQVIDQLVHFGRLGKGLMLKMLRKNTHAPALFVDIQSDVNRLTRKIKSATLNITHGKPPFGEFLRGTKNYIRKRETCLSFSIIRSAKQESRKTLDSPVSSRGQAYQARNDKLN